MLRMELVARVTDTCGGLAKALGSTEGSKLCLTVGGLGDGAGESRWAQRLVSWAEEGTLAAEYRQPAPGAWPLSACSICTYL